MDYVLSEERTNSSIRMGMAMEHSSRVERVLLHVAGLFLTFLVKFVTPNLLSFSRDANQCQVRSDGEEGGDGHNRELDYSIGSDACLPLT